MTFLHGDDAGRFAFDGKGTLTREGEQVDDGDEGDQDVDDADEGEQAGLEQQGERQDAGDAEQDHEGRVRVDFSRPGEGQERGGAKDDQQAGRADQQGAEVLE